MARPKKTFEQYILQEDAHSRKYVNQESYLKSPATAFLKYTVEAKDALIVKINDCNMDTRRLVVFEALNKLGWCDYMPSKDIKTLHGEKVGDIKINLPL